MSASTAEQVMISQLRETVALDHGRIRQIFDVKSCPGLVVVCDLADVNSEGDFETVEQRYELTAGAGHYIFENAEDALLAWDAAQQDREIVEALGETLLRHRHGLMRPLWSERKPADKECWIASARSFRRLLNGLGFDLARREPS